MIDFIVCAIATGFGITSFIFAMQANVCNSPGPTNPNPTRYTADAILFSTQPHIGYYPSPYLNDNPYNCVEECKFQCSNYANQLYLLSVCKDCLSNCTHPWGDNIDKCDQLPQCTAAIAGQANVCLELAKCFKGCAGSTAAGIAGFKGCLPDCRDTGKIAMWSGLTSFILFFLAPFIVVVPLVFARVTGQNEVKNMFFLFMCFFTWCGSAVIGIDIFILQFSGYDKQTGMHFMYVKDQTDRAFGLYQANLTPNFLVGEVWYRTHDPRSSHLPKDPPPTPSPPPVVPPKQVSAVPTPSKGPPTKHPEVTVGLQFEMKVNKFKNSEGQEQMIQEVQVNTIVPGGAADKAVHVNGRTVQKGDVVLKVGDIKEDGTAELHDVYGKPIVGADGWVHIVQGKPVRRAGTRIRFLFARHEEKLQVTNSLISQHGSEIFVSVKFQYDIVRELVPNFMKQYGVDGPPPLPPDYQ
eukprot:445861-Hanusia_phi.AAC.3